MNAEKLKKLQEQVRIGGKGTPRRKKKVVHSTPATDDKKLKSSLKKLSVNTIPGIEEVNIIKNDGTVIHFNNPKAQASLATNTFAITGHGELKPITDLMPGILSQLLLKGDGIQQLKKISTEIAGAAKKPVDSDDDAVPDLVDNFEEVAQNDKDDEKPVVIEEKKSVVIEEKKSVVIEEKKPAVIEKKSTVIEEKSAVIEEIKT